MKANSLCIPIVVPMVLVSVFTLFIHNTVFAYQEQPLIGPAFGDPSKTQTMPQEWIKKPIIYDASVGNVDLVVSLNQQFYDFIVPLIQRFGKEHGLKINMIKGTCGISANMLEKKQIDIGGYCCPPAKLDRLPGIRFHTLGVHPLSLLVNPENPVENVSLNQARHLFQGKIVRWSELGWKDIPVQPVARLHCKKRFGHWRLLLDNEDLFSPGLREVGSIPDMYSIIESTPGAVGIEMSWLGKAYEGKVATLKIDGFAPEKPENILSGKYPFYRTIYLTTWGEDHLVNPHAMKLISYLQKQMKYVEKKIGVISVSELQKAGWKFKGDELIGEPGK